MLDLRVIATYPRAVSGRRHRLLGPRQRHRHGGRGLRARQPRRREALHAESGLEGHRPRVLARAGRACARWCAISSGRRVALGDGAKKVYPSEASPIMKMGKKIVAARRAAGRPRADPRRSRAEVAGRRAAAVRARQRDRADAGAAGQRGRRDYLPDSEEDAGAGAGSDRRRSRSRARSPSSPARSAASGPSGSRLCSRPVRRSPGSIGPAPAVRRSFSRSAQRSTRRVCSVFDCDITDRAVDRAGPRSAWSARLGVPSVLVNNAGIDQPPDSGDRPLPRSRTCRSICSAAWWTSTSSARSR